MKKVKLFLNELHALSEKYELYVRDASLIDGTSDVVATDLTWYWEYHLTDSDEMRGHYITKLLKELTSVVTEGGSDGV